MQEYVVILLLLLMFSNGLELFNEHKHLHCSITLLYSVIYEIVSLNQQLVFKSRNGILFIPESSFSNMVNGISYHCFFSGRNNIFLNTFENLVF